MTLHATNRLDTVIWGVTQDIPIFSAAEVCEKDKILISLEFKQFSKLSQSINRDMFYCIIFLHVGLAEELSY